MFRAAARTPGGAGDGAFARSSAGALQGEGRAASSTRPTRGLGAGVVGRIVSRARLQTQRLADALPGGDARALGRSRRETVRAASAPARAERFASRRAHARTSRRGRLRAPRLGLLGGGGGRTRRLHCAARGLEIPRPAPGEPSATPTRARSALARGK